GDRDDGSASATPRTCPPSGTGDSFQMTASSPNTAWAARTGSATRSGRAKRPSTPGSGKTIVTFEPSGAFTVAVGSGFNVGPWACRATVSTFPRTVVAPLSASQPIASSESDPAVGRATSVWSVDPVSD